MPTKKKKNQKKQENNRYPAIIFGIFPEITHRLDMQKIV